MRTLVNARSSGCTYSVVHASLVNAITSESVQYASTFIGIQLRV